MAALFAGHAREEKPIRFFSQVLLLYKGDPMLYQGDLVQAEQLESGDYLITINQAQQPAGTLSAKWINILAGRQVVEE
jgi:hypothetical protein